MAKKKGQRSLESWGDQDWDYVTRGDEKKPKSKRGRYLPKKVRRTLSSSQKAATNRKKRKAEKIIFSGGGTGGQAEGGRAGRDGAAGSRARSRASCGRATESEGGRGG